MGAIEGVGFGEGLMKLNTRLFGPSAGIYRSAKLHEREVKKIKMLLTCGFY